MRFEFLSSVHWTLRFSMTIALASIRLAPIICSRVSWRFRGDFPTASTKDLGPVSKISSPCATPTNFPHKDLKEHFDIFPIQIPAVQNPFSKARYHDICNPYLFDVLLLFIFWLDWPIALGCFLSLRPQPPSPRFPRHGCLPPPCQCPDCSAVQSPSWLSANGGGSCQHSR